MGPEAFIRVDERAFALHKFESRVVIHPVLLHHIGDHNCCTSRDTCETVYKDFPSLVHAITDPLNTTWKRLFDIGLWLVQQRNHLIGKV